MKNTKTIAIFSLLMLIVVCVASPTLWLAHFCNTVEPLSAFLRFPFGIMQWFGNQCTELCRYPIIGAVLLVAIWATATLATNLNNNDCQNKNILNWLPSALICYSILSLGYWEYCARLNGFIFSNSLSLLVITALLPMYKINKYLPVVLIVILYPILGFWTLAFAFGQFFYLVATHKTAACLTIIAMIVAPWIWYFSVFSKQIPALEVYTYGLPIFDNEGNYSVLVTTIIVLSIVTTALSPLINKIKFEFKYNQAIFAIIFLTIAFGLYIFNKADTDEIKMLEAVKNRDWQQAIKISDQREKYTETIEVLRELSMAQSSNLDIKLITKHAREENSKCKSLKISAIQLASHITHYHYGRYNSALRWCTELGVKSGFSVGILQIMAEASLANGETIAAQKYTKMVNRALFYGDWQPQKPEPFTNEIHKALSNEIGSDHDLYDYLRYTLALPQNIGNKVSAQLARYFAMKDRSINEFRDIVALDSITNLDYDQRAQEACCLYCEPIPNCVENSTLERYKQFKTFTQQLSTTKDKQLIKEIYHQFGETYWWYVYFEK